jgi:hypothetical protein
MPKSLEDVKTALEALDGGKELFEVVTNEVTGLKTQVTDLTKKVDSEKQRGIRESKQRNEEIERLKPFKKAIVDGLGYDPDDTELDSFVDELKGTLSSKTLTDDDKVKNSPAYKEMLTVQKKMQKQLDASEQARKDAEEKREALRQKTIRTHVKSTLVSALSEKVYGADLLAESLISSGRVVTEDDEKTVVFKNGEDSVSFEEGIEKLLEERKDIVRNTQGGGGGSGGSGGTKDEKDPSKMTPEERTKHLRKLKARTTF